MMDESLRHRPSLTDDEAGAMTAAAAEALAFRQTMADRPARPTVSLDEAVSRFRLPLDEAGIAGTEVIDRLVRDSAGAIHHMAAPTFFGFVIGGSHPVGVAADMLVSAWGQNAGSAYETPAVTGMERAVCDWAVDLMGLPPESGVGIVTGGTVANMVGVMAARNGLLAAQGWNVEDKGLFGAPEIPVLIGADAHSAPFAALRYAALGAGRAVRVATDGEGRMRPDALKAALAGCVGPPLVILQAGQINTGAFDPFEELVPMIHARGGWAHVDGAFGLWVAAVPELRHRLAGVETADSWAVDLHKWLSAPYDAGLAIIRNRPALVAAMSARGAYLPATTDHWEPTDSTPELSRRARGIPSYAILRHLGRSGVRELVARHCRLAERIAARIAAEPGLIVLNRIHSNQVAVSCGEGAAPDTLTGRVLARVQDQGRVYPTHGEWRGRKIIRVSVCSYAMHEPDADLVADEIIDAWRWVQESPA